ncbi:hypothetical protein TNIN_153951 [Trichonephila inaurata madagascariensis]|uniref:Uncharacterized protein n=1 Tax=Trichonephila inaurata madagascariensis TaxID=2747483 RepID=A0A8X6Y331_9ARAC|nr:hypothetical protein TNIN_153951 [Trichonephila inaurata madagascariensis]
MPHPGFGPFFPTTLDQGINMVFCSTLFLNKREPNTSHSRIMNLNTTWNALATFSKYGASPLKGKIPAFTPVVNRNQKSSSPKKRSHLIEKAKNR